METALHEIAQDRRAVWLTFARWLVAGLTFQLLDETRSVDYPRAAGKLPA
jgi:hypothetical protein